MQLGESPRWAQLNGYLLGDAVGIQPHRWLTIPQREADGDGLIMLTATRICVAPKECENSDID